MDESTLRDGISWNGLAGFGGSGSCGIWWFISPPAALNEGFYFRTYLAVFLINF